MTQTANDRIAALEAKLQSAQDRVDAAQSMIDTATEQKDIALELASEYERQLKFAQVAALIAEGSVPEDVIDGLLRKYGDGKVVPISKARNTRKVAKTTPSDVIQPAAQGQQVPSLVARLKTIMGKKAMKVDAILEGLQSRPGWFPNSKNPKSYISSTLSQSGDFVNVSRGTYAVVGSKAAEGSKKGEVTAKAKEEPKKKRSRSQISQAISDQRKAVADGTLPTLKDRIKIVLTDEGTLKVSAILEKLESRGWLPNSGDPHTYLSTVLGSNKEDFHRVSRGHYTLTSNASEAGETASQKEPVRAKSTNGQPNAVKESKGEQQEMSKEEVDRTLEGLVGGDLSANPFD